MGIHQDFLWIQLGPFRAIWERILNGSSAYLLVTIIIDNWVVLKIKILGVLVPKDGIRYLS